jgi:DNA-binding NarL/FixJ family response regulator
MPGKIMPGKIRVLCVDDHAVMRDGIAYALGTQADMELVGEAANGEAAVNMFRQLRPDVTLMDLQLPGMDGIKTIEVIRASFPKAKIIVLTTYSGDIQAHRALTAGAAGYLLKHMLRKDLLGTIRKVHAGGRSISPQIAIDLAEHIGTEALSDREIEVLRSVSAGNSNKAVAEALFISEDTVKGHIKNILLKLGANDRTHAVMLAIRRGFLETGE